MGDGTSISADASRSREQVAQQPPDPAVALSRFLTRTLRAASTWWREHRATVGPWWFAASGAGRFDLAAPRGTCYLASSGAAAVRERLGPDLVAHRLVPSSLLDGRVVSRLALPRAARAANLDAVRAARFGVSRELPVMVPYAVPQAWAAALAAAGFDGIVASLRFSPGRALEFALFGDAGERADWPVDPDPTPAGTVADRLGVRLVGRPAFDELTVVRPPRITPAGPAGRA